MSSLPEIFICSTDAQQLNSLLFEQSNGEEAAESALELSTKLFEAQVVAPEALPHGTVRLHSTVTYEELPTRIRRRVTLVNPREADVGAGRISVFSPVARALLGHALGRVVDLVLPPSRQVSVRVVDVAPPHVDRVDESVFA